MSIKPCSTPMAACPGQARPDGGQLRRPGKQQHPGNARVPIPRPVDETRVPVPNDAADRSSLQDLGASRRRQSAAIWTPAPSITHATILINSNYNLAMVRDGYYPAGPKRPAEAQVGDRAKSNRGKSRLCERTGKPRGRINRRNGVSAGRSLGGPRFGLRERARSAPIRARSTLRDPGPAW